MADGVIDQFRALMAALPSGPVTVSDRNGRYVGIGFKANGLEISGAVQIADSAEEMADVARQIIADTIESTKPYVPPADELEAEPIVEPADPEPEQSAGNGW